nr:helix-turn-helix transcriptional regulator [Anaerosolibacter carboniphilus]
MLIQHYSEGFKLKVVAQELGMSESNLTRVFKQYYDMTPSEYVMKIRVKKATELLRGKDKSIVEIAHEVGFKSLSTFYKNFKENIGCTPREYRKRT